MDNDTDFAALCARLRELHKKANKPPWSNESATYNGRHIHDKRGLCIASTHDVDDEDSAAAKSDEQDIANADLICEARNALPALLDRIELLEAALRAVTVRALGGE